MLIVRSPARLAQASEDDLGARHFETECIGIGQSDGGERRGDIDDRCAALAHQMMMRTHIGIEPGRTGADDEFADLPHVRKFVKGGIDGAQRDGGQLGQNQFVDRIGSGMGHVAIESTKHRLALRRDLEAPLAIEIGEFLR